MNAREGLRVRIGTFSTFTPSHFILSHVNVIWLVFTLFAAMLVAFLLTALRRYERESAATALRELEEFRTELDRLTERVQTLEAIAAEPDSLDVRPRPEMSNPTSASSQGDPSVSSPSSAPPPVRPQQGQRNR